MKRIVCLRGGQPYAFVLDNGDKFDSTMTVWDEIKPIYTAFHVNTDPSLGYKDFGIVAEGTYKFMVGIRETKPSKPKVLFIYQATPERDAQIKTYHDITEGDTVLPSIIRNPNHDYAKVITWVLVHDRARTNDGSMGCITVDMYNEFIKNFPNLNEKGVFELRRDPSFQPDDRYRE